MLHSSVRLNVRQISLNHAGFMQRLFNRLSGIRAGLSIPRASEDHPPGFNNKWNADMVRGIIGAAGCVWTTALCPDLPLKRPVISSNIAWLATDLGQSCASFFYFHPVISWNSKMHVTKISFFFLIKNLTARLATIGWTICISKSHKNFMGIIF